METRASQRFYHRFYNKLLPAALFDKRALTAGLVYRVCFFFFYYHFIRLHERCTFAAYSSD